MKLIDLVDESFAEYQKPHMLLGFPKCDFKCNRDAGGHRVCQNWELRNEPTMEISAEEVVERYLLNSITHAVVLAGLDPFCSSEDMLDFVEKFRNRTPDDVVIYTGYEPEEVQKTLSELRAWRRILVKFGRYVPNSESVFDPQLGIWLASSNQRAEWIS